ncbi:MAG: SDR family NAD(P)-dependent oxidoreductase [Bacteroidetes bacterium]|nr:SDR family NAD(P)-dependent oxidoreductase [Bacteroidota bacterium]
MLKLKDKVIWITGASSGIGEALVIYALEQGACVVMSARNHAKLETLKNTHDKLGKAMILPIDISTVTDGSQFVNEVIKHFGKIDILVNNAGIGQKSFVLDTKWEIEKQVLDTNFTGLIRLSNAVAHQMKKSGGGNIAVITSIMGKFGMPMYAAYSASKHALYGYFDAWRGELKQHNIRISIICPGFINTNVSYNSLLADGSFMNKNSPAQEKGMPASKAAEKILKAIVKNERHVFVGGLELLSVPFRNLAPGLFYWLLDRMQKKNV